MADEDEEILAAEGEDAEDEQEERERSLLARAGVNGNALPDLQAGAVNHALTIAPPSGAPGWTALGPRNLGGAVRELIQDPNNPLTFYAGTSNGGAWKSQDDGLSWRPLGSVADVFPVAAIAVADAESRLVYVGTGERFGGRGGQGLFISPDGGKTLVRVVGRASVAANPGEGDFVARIAVDPAPAPASRERQGAGKVTLAGAIATRDGAQNLTTFLVTGDVVRIGAELRVVTNVTPATFTIDHPLDVVPGGAVDYFRASRRFWIANELGLFRFEPGRGFVGEGPFPPAVPNGQASDVRVIADPASVNDALLIYVGLQGQGLWQGRFVRATGALVWTRCTFAPALPAGIGRVLVTISDRPNPEVFAIADRPGQVLPTRVYRSAVAPRTAFAQRGNPIPVAANDNASGWYSMVLEVNPRNPLELVFGKMQLYVSRDGAVTWRRGMDWQAFSNGQRGHHADQHAAQWDRRVANRLWAAHDGGVAVINLPTTLPANPAVWPWRKRDYGMTCAQFYDVTVHKTFPFIAGGGLQDNGTLLSYGGLSWYMGGWIADGGSMAFTNNPRDFLASTQANIDRVKVGTAFAGSTPVLSAIPDAGAGAVMRARTRSVTGAIGAAPPFVAVVEEHPTANGEVLIGRARRVFRTTNIGNSWAAVGPTAPAADTVSSICFVPAQASNVFWFGTDQGNVFRSGTAANVNPPFVTAGSVITKVTTVPRNGGAGFRIAVASGGNQGEIFIADLPLHASPINWRKIDAGLPPGPVMALAFDPQNERHLYAGTLAGVYGAHDLPVFDPLGAAAPGPTWQTYNAGLPLVMVQDMDVSPITLTLRMATFGRAMFERTLDSTPRGVGTAADPDHRVKPVALLIRNTVIDDGRVYTGPAAALNTDPRQPPAVTLDNLHAFDIRVDAPRFNRFELISFGENIDGAEFDDSLVHDSPILGESNYVYVQVANRGHTTANNVVVHLYYAPTPVPVGPAPDAPPNLQAGFRANFPNDPPDGVWKRISQRSIGEILPGTPFVAKFEWIPPLDVGARVALLAITTTAADAVNLTTLADDIATLVSDRRIAVRATPTVANPIYLRDGIDDNGTPGSVAWSGRSPDIIILPNAPPANPHTVAQFQNLIDPRLTDRVRAPGANHVMVRVFNRTQTQFAANVNLFLVPPNQLDNPGAWLRIPSMQPVTPPPPPPAPPALPAPLLTPPIPPKSFRFTNSVSFTVPAALQANSSFLIVAVASPTTGPSMMPDPQRDADPGAPPTLDGTPDAATLRAFSEDRLLTFWRFVRAGVFADKVAIRAVRKN